jgi:hypothetical protein
MVVGYVVMRIAMVAQWLRAARGDRRRRATGERRLVDSTHQIPIALLLLGCTHTSYLPWDDLSSRLNPVVRTLSSSLSR